MTKAELLELWTSGKITDSEYARVTMNAAADEYLRGQQFEKSLDIYLASLYGDDFESS